MSFINVLAWIAIILVIIRLIATFNNFRRLSPIEQQLADINLNVEFVVLIVSIAWLIWGGVQ